MKQPLIVIMGPTASGKTSLAIELARQCGGEIICADSRTIYKEMNVGTAKPTLEERRGVPHWGLDLIAPGERFSAAEFKQFAVQKIDEIRSRGNVPFLVGGTGLYIDAVVFDYDFGPEADESLRKNLNDMTLTELYEYCNKNNIKLPENDKNKRYVIRAIEQKNTRTTRKTEPLSTSIIVGIATDKETLRTRIAMRTERLFDNGVVAEATLLGKKYGWQNEAMTGNIYRLIHSYLENTLTLEEIKKKNTTLDWRLAKRQLTWMRRDPHVQWMSLTEARNYLKHVLANG